jgi:hypothetical protein
VLSDIENQVKRFEQMLTAFEQLHTDELRRFEEQLSAYRQMQNDELQMLREQLKQLQAQLSAFKAADPEPDASMQPPAASPQPAVLTVSRRELLTGILRPSNPERD